MENTPTNRFQGTLPEGQTGQKYKFADAIDEAREDLLRADRIVDARVLTGGLTKADRESVESYLRSAERMIELARKVML